MVRASLGAEKKCKRRPAVPFSPAIRRSRLVHTILRLHVKGLESHCTRHNQIRKRMQMLEAPIDLPPDLEMARVSLKAALDELRQTEKNELRTGRLREDFLDRIQQGYLNAHQKKQAGIVKKIRHSEASKRAASKCRALTAKQHRGVVTLQIPAMATDLRTATEWIELTDNEAIQMAL